MFPSKLTHETNCESIKKADTVAYFNDNIKKKHTYIYIVVMFPVIIVIVVIENYKRFAERSL